MRAFFVPVTCVVLLALGGALRLYRIGEKGFWWDEVRTVESAVAPGFQTDLPFETLIDPAPSLRLRFRHASFPESLKALRETFHPPLFYLVIGSWFRLTHFSQKEGLLRIPVAFFGNLAILLVLILGRVLVSWRVGTVAALFLTLSPFQVSFSQELRHYTLLTIWALLAYLMLVFVLRPKSRWAPLLLGLCIAAALYTHYFAFLIPLSQLFYILTSPRARPFLKQWIKGILLAFFLVALYLLRLLIIQRKVASSIWIWEGALFPQLLESLFSLPVKVLLGPGIGLLFYRLSRLQQCFWLLAGIVWIAVWLYGLYRWLKTDPKRLDIIWLLVCWFVFPIVFVLGMDALRHSVVLSVSRYFSWTAPSLILLLALGLLGLQKRVRWILGFMLVLVMSFLLFLYYQDPIKEQDWRGLAQFLQSQARPRDLHVMNRVGRPSWVGSLNTLCLTYYHGTEGHPIYLTGETFSPKMKEMLQAQKRFWLIPQNRFFSDPGPPFKPVVQRTFKGVGTVVLFERN